MDGKSLTGHTRIPIGDMARGMIREIYPQLTEQQAEDLNAGRAIGENAAPNYPLGVVGISALLVFSEKGRLKLAQKAVNQFVRQLYPLKQLVIVNASGIPVTTQPHPEINEIVARPGMVGELRNQGMAVAKYDWVLPCWDDDDYYHPARLAFQALHLVPGHACCLSTQIRANINTAAVFRHNDPGGIANTMIVPKGVGEFADVNMAEDTAFLAEAFDDRVVVVDNKQYPASTLSIAAYHGHNALPEPMFMLDYADPSRAGRWALSPDEIVFVQEALETFGLHTEKRKPPADVTAKNLP